MKKLFSGIRYPYSVTTRWVSQSGIRYPYSVTTRWVSIEKY